MPITILDGVLLGITLVSAVLAMIRGFSREVLSVASWVAAGLAAYYFYPRLTPFVKNYMDSDTLAMVVAAAIIFFLVLIVVSILTMRIADFVIDSRIGPLDRTMGFLFGAARGILLMVVGVLFLNWLIPPSQQPPWVAEAKSKPFLDSLGNSLINKLPEDADGAILEGLRPSEEPAAGEVPPTDGETPQTETPEEAPSET